LFLIVVLVFGFAFQAQAETPIGVFVNSNTNSLQIIDPLTQDVSPSLLKGELGSYGGGLFDVVITPNGKTAIISNFGDSTLYFVDITDGLSGEVTKKGYTPIGFFAEDMAVTPDGKYVLVTDGGFSSVVAVVDINTMELVSTQRLKNNQAQAVAISPDGKTALFADYWNMALHNYALADGVLTFRETVYPAPGTQRLVNVVISPNGKTVIGVGATRYDFPVYYLNPNGYLVAKGVVTNPTKSGQSCAFSPDSKKAYYLSSTYNHGAQIHVLDVSAPGVVAYEDSVPLSIPRGTSQLFGVDTIAIDTAGQYLYVANPTLSGGVVHISVIDLSTNTEVNQIRGNGLPTGIAFGVISD